MVTAVKTIASPWDAKFQKLSILQRIHKQLDEL